MNRLQHLISFSALSLLALSVAQAQRPVAANAGAEKPWPNVDFQEVFDVPTYFPGMTKASAPPNNTNETNDMFSFLTNAGDGSNRIYLVERIGKIWTVENGKILGEPLLDISSFIDAFQPNGTEAGLLSIAFSPDYKNDHQFYVFYVSAGTAPGTTRNDLTIARYKVGPQDAYHALKDSGEIIFTVPHPRQNHFGGQIAFGKDGMLYLATGDGDGARGNDLENNAQNLGVYLGKMLRFNVKSPPDPGKKYHVPTDNPFVSNPNAKPEIWALGLRNPYRFSFDPANGDLYIGNVGQEQYEQIYYQPGTSKGGENYGWSIYEGTHPLTMAGGGPVPNKPPQQPGTPDITYPIVDLSHPAISRGRVVSLDPMNARCIIGGYVYRGTEFPTWQGTYFFSDWILGEVWATRRNSEGKWETHEVDGGFGKNPAKGVDTFGVDEKGNLYMTSFGDGKVYKLVETPPAAN